MEKIKAVSVPHFRSRIAINECGMKTKRSITDLYLQITQISQIQRDSEKQERSATDTAVSHCVL